MTTLTIAGSPPRTLETRAFTTTERDEKLKGNHSLFLTRAKAWSGKSFDQETASWFGTQVKLHVDPDDPTKGVKKDQVKAALAVFQGLGGEFAMLDNRLEVYIHNLNQACLGYVLPMGGKLKAVMILGNGVLNTASQLVSTIVYEENGGSGEMATALRARTAVFHEFGHIFHQLAAGSQYLAMGRLMILKGKSSGELAGERSADHSFHFPSRASKEDMEAFAAALVAVARNVSTYAATHPNEFVAETFAGLMMGRAYSDEVMAAYRTLGGPAVPTDRLVTRGRSRRVAIGARPPALAELPAPVLLEGDGL